jgi:hypothetical protein
MVSEQSGSEVAKSLTLSDRAGGRIPDGAKIPRAAPLNISACPVTILFEYRGLP